MQVRFMAANIGIEKQVTLFARYGIIEGEDSSVFNMKVLRYPGSRNGPWYTRLVRRSLEPGYGQKGSESALKEHCYCVETILDRGLTSFSQGFSSCVYVNYKSDADEICFDKKRILNEKRRRDKSFVENMVIWRHYNGIDEPELREIENALCNPGKDNVPIVTIATLGLGVVVDFKNVSFVSHYTCPTSFSRIFQEWGRAGRGINVPKVGLTFYSQVELDNLHLLQARQNNILGKKCPTVRKRLIQEGITILTGTMESCKPGASHLRSSSYKSRSLSLCVFLGKMNAVSRHCLSARKGLHRKHFLQQFQMYYLICRF